MNVFYSAREFLRRYRKTKDSGNVPMLASACPGMLYVLKDNKYKFVNTGWICYAEKTHGSYILPYIRYCVIQN